MGKIKRKCLGWPAYKRLQILFLFACLGNACVSVAQDSSFLFEPQKIISGNFSAFYTDNLNNFFLLSPQSSGFVKYNDRGDSIGAYNEVRKFGSITDMDVSNPLKTLVYYKEFNTVIALDRLLNTTASFDLRKAGILQSTAIALSYDNMLWLYDSRDTRIKKINDNTETVFESADLKSLFDHAPQPQKLIDRDGLLYLYDREEGLFVFDYYGAYRKTYPYTGLEDVQVFKDNFYGRRGDALFVYALSGWKDSSLHFNLQPVTQMQLNMPYVYLLSDGNIFSYKTGK